MRLPLLIIVHWPLAWAYVLVSWMCWDPRWRAGLLSPPV